tara:strand:+ start:1242 stop:1454 length:213 start_codon:yes stop_codon:yes gene_type:complete
LYERKTIINNARSVYFEYLCNSCFNSEPKGVVFNQKIGEGKVIFNNPILLPDEHFIPIEYIKSNKKKRIK